MKSLVTGATGFVGYHLVKKLVEQGQSIKVMVRSEPPPHLQDLSVEFCRGDLLDNDSMKKSLEGCRQLYHVAAHYTLWEADPEIFYKVNVTGTRNLLNLALDCSIEKIVYTSSVATIKPSDDETPVNENTKTIEEEMIGHYKRSKYLAETEAQKIADDGAPVVIVNPSAPVGPFDIKPTPTGKIIVDFLKGKMFGYLHTGLNMAAVEDVAQGHILAAQKGKHGQRYILGGENLYLIDIFRKLAKISGKPAPKRKVPYWLAYSAGVASELKAKASGEEPDVPLDGVRMAKKCMFFDSDKAVKELGYKISSVDQALERAISWFQQNNYV